MLDAKERLEQLAVQDRGLHGERSGITAVQCPGGGPVAGDCRELAVWVGQPPSAPGPQQGKQVSSDYCDTSVSRATVRNR